MIDGIARPARLLDLGQLLSLGRHEGPVQAVIGARGDPALEELPVLLAERVLRVRRRHDLLFVLREDALDQLALFGVSENNGGPAGLSSALRRLALIESQTGLACLLVRAVALETVLRQNGPNPGVEGILRTRREQGRSGSDEPR